MSPTVFKSGPYRFYFVSHDLHEPPHVHVDRETFSAKFWLSPISLAHNLGFSPRELRKLEALVSENQKELLEAWNDFFGA
ncbi:MAG: hypothetical protein A4E63_02308 [Syntrophorhabdus sp. PtaU1.Bin050]|jgi:hypothetical protein|nr:MAG: hypothetical protein A4E63_02308 [Syntrophorhabdus sp. PtaU1.Bin050]